MFKIFTSVTWNDNEDKISVIEKIKTLNNDKVVSGLEINIKDFFHLFNNDEDLINNTIRNSKYINGMCGLESKKDPMTQEEKLKWFEKAIKVGFNTIDIEYTKNFDDYFNGVNSKIKLGNVNFESKNNVVVEYANFEKTPNFEESCKIIDEILKKEVFAIKFVCMVKSIEDNDIFFELLKKYSNKVNLISFGMSDLGLSSRVKSVYYGSYATYGHSGVSAKACPGQIYYKDLYKKIINTKI